MSTTSEIGDPSFAAVIKAVGFSAWVWDLRAGVVRAPVGAGQDPNEHWVVPSSELVALIDPDDFPTLRRARDEALSTGTFTAEYRVRIPGGGTAWRAARGQTYYDAEGRPTLIAGVSSDVTGQHLAEVERRALEAQLRQAQKMEAIGRLAGGVAHDFNNLLTVLQVSVEFLLEDLSPSDPRHADVLQVRAAVDRGTALTRQLLAFSRKQVLTPRPLDLNQVVRDVRPMLERLIGEDIAVEAILADQLGMVLADTGQIEQVLLNLVVNARDAMPDGGRLRIGTADVDVTDRSAPVPDAERAVPPGRYVALAVTDTGAGMTDEVSAHVFEPFYTTKEAGKGTGLGLSTVYGIVKQSGGYVWVDSKPGVGSTFTIYLPRATEAVREAEDPPPPVAHPRGSETLLLVEDDDALRALAARILAQHGYTVLPASDGVDALAVLSRHEGAVDLVVTDVVTPRLSGSALVDRLRSSRPNVPVLYMSGYPDDEIVRRGVRAPHTAFIPKPFTPNALLEAIRDVLNGVPREGSLQK